MKRDPLVETVVGAGNWVGQEGEAQDFRGSLVSLCAAQCPGEQGEVGQLGGDGGLAQQDRQ